MEQLNGKDIPLHGKVWNEVINNFEPIFKRQTHYSVFILSLSIGIMYDKQIIEFEHSDDLMSVPRSVITNHMNEFDFIFKSAILTTENENFTEDERLNLAFGDEKENEFDVRNFFIKFANYGVIKLQELISKNNVETMENLKNFLKSLMENNCLDNCEFANDINEY
ncbi:MAG: hypothetical protein RSE56_02870 [Bacilli bacterium]